MATRKIQGAAVLKDTLFEDNFAEKGGGGVFVDDAAALDIDCDLPLRDPKGGASWNLSNIVLCLRLTENAVGDDGYGPDIASAATSFVMVLVFRNGSIEHRESVDPGAALDIPNWRSGDSLPEMSISLVDHFHQGPAIPTQRETTNAVVNDQLQVMVESPDGLVSNRLVANISDGNVDLTVGVPLRLPGDYTLLIWIGDNKKDEVTLHVTCRDCVIGEVSTLDGRLCLKCEATHYNFKPTGGRCLVCPEDAHCDQWGIKPKRDHWIPSPCFPEVKECLSEDACRGGKLKRLFQNRFWAVR